MEPGYTFAASVSDAVLNQFKDYARSAVVSLFIIEKTGCRSLGAKDLSVR